MREKWRLLVALLAAGIASFAGIAAVCADRPPRPNIVLVLTDDLGWADTSVRMMADRSDSGSDFFRTPHLERLTREGMVFSDAYSPAPVCSPTRDSILYGRTPARLHHAVLIGKASVPTGAMTIPQMLKAIDPSYVTAHFGKWGCTPKSPEAAGFDVSDGNTDNFHGDWRAIDDKRPLPEDDPKRIFSVTRRAGDFMTQQVATGRPFYLRISHYAVHVGHQSLPQTRDKYRNLPRPRKAIDQDYEDPATFSESFFRDNWLLNYAAMIEDLDTGLGMLLDKLDQLGIADNTLVFFTSDNGGGFRGNAPLHGGKADLWEGGIRVPLAVRGPGISAGADCNVPVAGWDFWPTFRELAGGQGPLPAGIDGGSLVRLLKAGNQGHVIRATDALIFHFPWFDGVPESAIRLANFKLMENLNTGETRLFDLSTDIGESQDLSRQMPQKVQELHARLTQYLESVGAETIEQNRRNRIQQLREFEVRERKQIEKLREQLRAAEAGERERLLSQIEQHQRAIEGHEAALERVEKGRNAKW